MGAAIRRIVEDGRWNGLWIRVDRAPGLGTVIEVELEAAPGAGGWAPTVNWNDPLGGGPCLRAAFLAQTAVVGTNLEVQTQKAARAGHGWTINGRG